MKNGYALAIALALAGCSTTTQAPPSYSFNASSDAVKTAIVQVYSQDGFAVIADSQFQIAMERHRGGAALRHIFSVTGTNPVTVSATIQVAQSLRTTDFTWDSGARSFLDGKMQQVNFVLSRR